MGIGVVTVREIKMVNTRSSSVGSPKKGGQGLERTQL
jgi:hypothetical protein